MIRAFYAPLVNVSPPLLCVCLCAGVCVKNPMQEFSKNFSVCFYTNKRVNPVSLGNTVSYGSTSLSYI